MRLLFSDYLEPISFLVFFVVFTFYLWRVQRLPRYSVLAFFYLLAAIMMAVSMTLAINTQLYNVLYLLSTLSLGYYFISILKSKAQRYASGVLVMIVVIYFILSSTLGWDEYLDSRGHALASLLLVCMMFMYYRQLMQDVSNDSIALNFDFWFVSSQLLYQMGSFGIFLSYNYFTQKILPDGNYTEENRSILTYLWMVHNVLLFLSAIITAIGLVWKVYHRKSP